MSAESDVREADRPVRCIIAEMQDMAAWIERTKPEGLLYISCMPVLKEGAAALAASEAARERAETERDELKADVDRLLASVTTLEAANDAAEKLAGERDKLKKALEMCVWQLEQISGTWRADIPGAIVLQSGIKAAKARQVLAALTGAS